MFANNFFDSTDLTCADASNYAKQYCYLHGGGHVNKDLSQSFDCQVFPIKVPSVLHNGDAVSYEELGGFSKEKLVGLDVVNGEKILPQNPFYNDDSQVRWTSYNVILPYMMMICLILIKASSKTSLTLQPPQKTYDMQLVWTDSELYSTASTVQCRCYVMIHEVPRFIWTSCVERGVLVGLVGKAEPSEKIVAGFKKLRSRNVQVFYQIGFALCELLNLVMLHICFIIVNKTLKGQFSNFGQQVMEFYKQPIIGNNNERKFGNPMCQVEYMSAVCKNLIVKGVPDPGGLLHCDGWHHGCGRHQEQPLPSQRQFLQPVLLCLPLVVVAGDQHNSMS